MNSHHSANILRLSGKMIKKKQRKLHLLIKQPIGSASGLTFKITFIVILVLKQRKN